MLAAARLVNGHCRSANHTMVTSASEFPHEGSARVTGIGPGSPEGSASAARSPKPWPEAGAPRADCGAPDAPGAPTVLGAAPQAATIASTRMPQIPEADRIIRAS